MDIATKKLMEYATKKGVTIAAISKNTKISPGALYPSSSGKRPLRADEFLAVCDFLGVDPRLFGAADSAK